MRKKPHWTQTPAGRAIQSRRMKRAWKDRSSRKKMLTRPPHKEQSRATTQVTQAVQGGEDLHVAYLFGRVQGLVYAYAESAGVSGRVLADRVGALLQHPDGR